MVGGGGVWWPVSPGLAIQATAWPLTSLHGAPYRDLLTQGNYPHNTSTWLPRDRRIKLEVMMWWRKILHPIPQLIWGAGAGDRALQLQNEYSLESKLNCLSWQNAGMERVGWR